MVRREARPDQRDLSGLRLIDREVAVGRLHRGELRGGMLGAPLAKIRVRRRPHARGEPHAAFLVEHGVVHARLAVPDPLVAPEWRRQHRVLLRRRRGGIADEHPHLRHLVLHGIEHGEEVRALLGGTEESTDLFPVLDPVKHKVTQVRMLVRDPATPSSKQNPMLPSPFWGDERIWDSQTSMHNPMLDEKGRVWFTSRVGPAANPDFCKRGSEHPSAKLTPVESSNRHLSVYEPKTGKITLIRTCFPTHHLVFAEDANNTLWTSAGGPQSGVIGWLNRKMFDATGDEVRSQGWTALILDTNGNGKRDEDYVEPNQPVDPAKDKRIVAAFYGIGVNPDDGTIWGTVLGFPGYVIRLDPGSNPPATALAEVFEPPLPGYGPRGMDIDRRGVVWTPLSSGHMASFDRKKCRGPLNGPTATGKQCPEGWTLYPFPGPQLANVTETGSAEASYYTWVDQFDTFGLGRDVPMATGNLNESLLALVNGTFVNLRVPYPLGFYTKWMDGRIDDPGAGWKGKGLWATVSTRAPFHMEGGKGTTSKVVKFQLRPDPLAR